MSRIDLPFASMLYSPFRLCIVTFGRTFYHDVRPDDRFAPFICNDTGHFPVLRHWNGALRRFGPTFPRVILSLKIKIGLPGDLVQYAVDGNVLNFKLCTFQLRDGFS